MTDAVHLWKCPNGHLGYIDDEQLEGEVSIICAGYEEYEDHDCNFHGDVDEGTLLQEDALGTGP